MKRCTLVTAFIGCSLLAAAPIPKKEEAKDYTGLKLGAKWTYSMTEGKDKFELVTEVVEDAIRDDKSRRIVLSQCLTLDKITLSEKKESYRIASGFVEQTEVNGREIAIQRRLPASLKSGDTWTAEAQSGKKELIVYTVGEPEEIEVPAGKYKALCVTTTVQAGETKRLIDKKWLVEGVGRIKLEVGGGVQVLTAFTPGKDK